MDDLARVLFGGGGELGVVQMALRAAAVFVMMMAMLRIAGRRAIGQHRVFDACTAVLVGSVLSRAVVGASAFWPTIAAGLAIVVLHRLVAMAGVRWPRFESLVNGDKRELVRDGARDRREMARALVTQRDLDEAVRKRTGDEDVPIARAVLERDGAITVKIASSPEGDFRIAKDAVRGKGCKW
jgi:uncharacterized membrane protein YcaP (DUF421 family)